MKILKKVNTFEVKKCFVISQLVRKGKIRGFIFDFFKFLFRKGFLTDITLEDFKERLEFAKKQVSLMKEKNLDFLILKEDIRRLISYNRHDWYVCEISEEEMGVWKCAGGLPLSFTDCSLKETVEKLSIEVKNDLRSLKNTRAKYAIFNILKTNVDLIQTEEYLLPIIIKNQIGARGRRRLKFQTDYNIDDGCIRSIALGMKGIKIIKAYIGFKK